MGLDEVLDMLNFFINKNTGAWYTIPELINLLHFGQLALYSDYKPKYATSQLIKDILSPFRDFYNFTSSDSISGYIVVPANRNYLDLIDIQIQYNISSLVVYVPISMINEDERSHRLNSQIDPVTITNPVCEQTAPGYFRMYPLSGYTGTVTFFKQLVKPVFSYVLISGRIPVYDPTTSVQLQWRQTEIMSIIIKSLNIAGINLSDQELEQFAESKSQGNFSLYKGTSINQNRL